MKHIISVLLFVLVAGCASSGTIPLGQETSAYPGWTSYCERHAERDECK